MKDSKEHNLEGFGCLGGLFFAFILGIGIALIALLLIVLDPSQDNYRGVQLIIVLIYVPFLGLLKWSYSRRLKAWSFAADSLGLLLSREYGFGYFTYSLEGEYKGYSIRAWDVWGGGDSVGFQLPTPMPRPRRTRTRPSTRRIARSGSSSPFKVVP